MTELYTKNKLQGFTLFTGGGGVDIAMKLAGITPIGGIEYDLAIADIARLNGIEVTTANILECNPADFPMVDFLHASPPCPNFSQAKTNAGETEQDIALAQQVCEFIRVMNPKYFTLENVWGYRKSQSWKIIYSTLNGLGYGVTVDHVNFADYGVPQSRKRMVVRAIRDVVFMPYLPQKQKQIGWYEVIKDIFHLKHSYILTEDKHRKFSNISGLCLIDGQNTSFKSSGITSRNKNDVCFTLTSKNLTEYTIFHDSQWYHAHVSFLPRWQTFPDWYKLPDTTTLASRIIGNAVPPIGMSYIIKSMIDFT